MFHFSDYDKANCLNDYFASISHIDERQASVPNLPNYTTANLSNIVLQESEIRDVIKILDTNKAVGEDLISHKVLKNVCQTICLPLCLLFNKSLSVCVFPKIWKSAIVMPLFKKGNTNLCSNYRPISLLSCVGKLMERVVYKHMYNHLINNNLIYEKQSGFLKGHSTVFQLLDIYHQIAQSLDTKCYTCIVFCDISKAFDRVWHKGLLCKLEKNGINGNLLKWIESYLVNRTQKVFVGSSVSQSQQVKAGVPQGSVLGPLFFLVYVNDIIENLLCITRLFADDTSLACTTSSIPDLEGIINHDLALINDWSKKWLVDFNPNKTEALFFSLKPNVIKPNLVFDHITVNQVNHHKHLGLTFSSNGKWHDHIQNITKSASKLVGLMRKLKYTLNRQSLNQIYISFVRPILEYASIVWDGCTKLEQETLEKVQNEAARVVTGLTLSVSLQNLYREVNWLSLAERRKYQKLLCMFRVNKDNVPNYIFLLILQYMKSINTYIIYIQNYYTCYRKFAIFFFMFYHTSMIIYVTNYRQNKNKFIITLR